MERQGYVGRTADGDRLWLEVELREQDAQGRFRSAVDHKPVTTYTELAISASGLRRGRRAPAADIDFGGQCVETLRAVVHPAKGWTVGELQDLAEIWDRWHLNGMQAGCAHQTPWIVPDQYGRPAPSLMLTKRCPESGYRYGHAWLVKAMPAEVEAKVRAYAVRLDGTSPTR